MKKKGLGLIGYLLILIGLAFGAFVICLAIMIIAPDVQIAGFKYGHVSSSDQIYYRLDTSDNTFKTEDFYKNNIHENTLKSLTESDISELVINAGGHDVIVRQLGSENSHFAFTVSSQYSGFYKVSKYPDALDFKVNYTPETKVLTLNFITPTGLTFNSSGEIVVDLPYALHEFANVVVLNNLTGNQLDTYGTKLTINSNTGDVVLGGSSTDTKEVCSSAFACVNVKTTKGNINLNKNFYPAGTSLSLETEKGDISIANNINQKDMTVSFKTTKGDISLTETDIKCKDLTLDTQKGDFKFNEVELLGETKSITWNGEGGRLIANNIKGSIYGSENTKHTNFVIKKIDGQFYLPNGEYCDVDIDEISGKVEIKAKNSKINISNCPSTIVIETQKGAINLENCTLSNTISATKANVNLNKCKGVIKIKTTTGKITGSVLDITGTDNYIKSEKKTVDITINQALKFNLSAKSYKKDVSIKYASIEDTKKEFANLQINGGDTSKVLKIEARKQVKITNYVEG